MVLLYKSLTRRASIVLTLILACGVLSIAKAQTSAPILVSEPTSTRAIAVDAVTFMPGPFAPASNSFLVADHRTRVMLFAVNFPVQPGEPLYFLTADAEDGAHHHHSLQVEYFGPVPGQPWLTAIVVVLSNDLADVGDVLVRISRQGLVSNRVRVAIGHEGGGLPDDPGSGPTPAPPYVISGRVTDNDAGLDGVSLQLSGAQTETFATSVAGTYQFSANFAGGNYTVTPSKSFYDFIPTSRTFNNLSNHQTSIDFVATRQVFTITGKVRDDTGQPMAGLSLALSSEAGTNLGTTVTAADGSYSFASLPAGYKYTVTPAGNNFFSFTGQTTDLLAANLTLDFNAVRRTYTLGGKITEEGTGVAGVQIALNGTQGITTTDANGNYNFGNVPAGYNYTIEPSKTHYFFTPVNQSISNLGSDQLNIGFVAQRQTFAISGYVHDDANQPLQGFALTLTSEAGTNLGITVSANDGGYAFNNLPAGFRYTVTPSGDSFFTFSSQTTDQLGANLTLNFNAIRRTYTISGSITEEFNGLAGVTVALNGSQAVATTNSSGQYSFPNLPAGQNYSIVPSLAHHFFTPVSQSVNNLGGDQTVNFTSIHRYFISGRVTQTSGQAVPGVKITLTGSTSETTRSAVDGSYAFMVPPGSYTLTPSIEQDWYSFSPAGPVLNNITDDHTINFTATSAPPADPEYVLEFDGSPKTVFHGYYWDPDVDLGHFFWEFWAMPGPNAGATYLLSDGYGGAHALLFGFANLNTSEPNRYQMLGNIFNGVTHDNFFNSDQGPAPGEWGHIAVGWDGANIITYFNGVPVGKSAFTGPRRTPGVGGGGSWLFIGGSNHNNFQGRIAQARGYEVYNPREDPTGVDKSLVESSFAPDTVFQRGGNLLSNFSRPANTVADLSDGYPTTFHPGVLRGMHNGFFDPCSGCPQPEFVIDPTAPHFATNAPPVQVNVATPSTVPGGARVFDSFSRANSTYVFNGTGGLGATEGGSDGARTWLTNLSASQPQPFGILNGRGVMLANYSAVTWITTSSATANLETSVERRPGLHGSGLDTGISFRVLDDRNFFFAYTSAGVGDGNPRTLTVGYYLNGQRFNLASGITLPASWTTLRVVTKNTGALSVYAGGSLLFTTTNGNLANSTGCGLYNNSAGLGLVNRWDNFTVFDAP